MNFGDEFCLSAKKPQDSWFLTKEKKIGRIVNVVCANEAQVKLCFFEHQGKTNFFDTPIESKYLDIYAVNRDTTTVSQMELIDVGDIKCKLVCLKHNQQVDVFVPLLHTKKYLPNEL